jgi:DNA-binding XRE family transcriptional regulator
MNALLPTPVTETTDTVTLRKQDWEALAERLEDIDDVAAVQGRRAFEDAVGKDAARRDYLTGDEALRLIGGENPIRIWREKRGLTQRALAARAGVSVSYLAEIETGKKPGSAEMLLKLGSVLAIAMEHLVPRR